MTKNEFIEMLDKKLYNYPDRNDIISYYYELISDKIDSGEKEEDVIASLGDIDDIIRNVENNGDANTLNKVNTTKNNAQELKAEKVEGIIYNSSTSYSNQDNSATKPVNDGPHGGRKFWYVVWRIAIIVFIVASILALIGVIFTSILCISVTVMGCVEISTDLSVGLMIAGIGAFLTGMSFAGINYISKVPGFLLSNRAKWTQNIRNGLKGE